MSAPAPAALAWAAVVLAAGAALRPRRVLRPDGSPGRRSARGEPFADLRARSRRRARARARAAAIQAELPFSVDLLRVAVGAGLTVPGALGPVARAGSGPVSRALGDAARRVSWGQHPAEAVAEELAPLGPEAVELARRLAGSVREGTPASAALDRVAAEIRDRQRRRAQDDARRVPVRLLFPLVLCTLPAFALLTVVPLLAASVGALDP